MMQTLIPTCLAACMLLSCAPSTTAPAGGYQAKVIQWGVVVNAPDGSHISTARTGLPFVEDWEFIDGGSGLVTVSRARHGAALVELFDTATGRRKAGIKAYEIRNGRPAWAAHYAE